MAETRLASVDVGRELPIENAKRSGVTGIFKRPVRGPVEVGANGLAGDPICDTENHGGPDQAVYVFGAPDYAWWSEAPGRELPPGIFGENLTILGFESMGALIGDRLYVGARVVGEPAFLRRFRRAERSGVYCRVLDEGRAEADDTVALRRYRGEGVTDVAMFRDFFDPDGDEGTIRRHLAAPIAVRDRVEGERQLEEAVSRRSGAQVEG